MSTRTRIAITVLVALAVLGILIPTGINAYQNATRPPVLITLPPGISSQPAPSPPPPSVAQPSPTDTGLIYVHVAGAVHSPNVYKLPNGARVFDAIHQAGGALTTADIDAINLAEPLHDGEKVYVPTKSEAASSSSISGDNQIGLAGSSDQTATVSGAKHSTGGLGHVDKLKTPGQGTVDINTATGDDLQRIPGVGPKKFAKMRPFVRV